ncbi:MAG: amino acid permease [Candidatus Omnitrophica bacterium]|nr:amino acid permease [Candidatus Omnitrophota bacterium]
MAQTNGRKPAAQATPGLLVSSAPGTLRRDLGFLDAAAIVIGCVVGVGIFRTAASVATHLQSSAMVTAVWLFGGIISFCGAICYAELGAAYPKAGGDYVYLTKAYGRLAGFLFGWTKLFIERIGTIAILGFVFAEYLGFVFVFTPREIKVMATAAIVFLTAANAIGVHVGKRIQNLLTSLKIAALAAIVAAGFTAGHGEAAHLQPVWPSVIDGGLLRSFGVALAFVLWTYGGWAEPAYMAEEIRRPERNLPLAMFWGLALVTGFYLLVNWVYILYIPLSEMPRKPLVAAEVMQAALGPAGAKVTSLMVACSAFGALNGMIMTTSRILLAVGRDHPLFARLSEVHPHFSTPIWALTFNTAAAVLLVWVGTFEQIVTYSTVVISVFFAMTALAVIRLRKKDPHRHRPYRVWGYPATPIFFVAATALFIVDVAVMEPKESVFGFGLLLMGLPLYVWSQMLKKPAKGKK